LYGLKKSPRTWFSIPNNHVQQQGYKRGAIDNNVYIKIKNQNKLPGHGFQDLIIIYSNKDTKEDLLITMFVLKLKIRI